MRKGGMKKWEQKLRKSEEEGEWHLQEERGGEKGPHWTFTQHCNKTFSLRVHVRKLGAGEKILHSHLISVAPLSFLAWKRETPAFLYHCVFVCVLSLCLCLWKPPLLHVMWVRWLALVRLWETMWASQESHQSLLCFPSFSTLTAQIVGYGKLC